MTPSQAQELALHLAARVRVEWQATHGAVVSVSEDSRLPRLRVQRLHQPAEGRAPWALVIEGAAPSTQTLADASPCLIAEYVATHLRRWVLECRAESERRAVAYGPFAGNVCPLWLSAQAMDEVLLQ